MLSQLASVGIIIPVYNEEKTIGEIVKKVKSADTGSLKKEIIIVDDCSSDKTYHLLLELKKTVAFKLLRNPRNFGKGFSTKQGLLNSKADIVVIQDADLEYDPAQYPKLLKPILDGHADAVYGSRFIDSAPHRVLYFYHFLANRFLTGLTNLLTNLNLTDMETGYKVIKGDLARKIAPQLKSNRFGFEPEITCRLARQKNIRIYEVGISYYGRTYEEGKKIAWIDGFKAIYAIIRYGLFD